MKILIIEDDAAIVANLYKFLERVGYHPDLAPRRSAGTSALLNIASGTQFFSICRTGCGRTDDLPKTS